MLKVVAGALCGYELAALATGKVPTLTALCGRYRLLGPVLVTSLAVHLYRQPRVRAELECRLCIDPLGDEP